jgi:hypothetical protein
LVALADPSVTEHSLYIALAVLNLLIFVLITLLAFKTFNGRVRVGLFIFVTVIAAIGTSWLNTAVPLRTLNF